MLDAGLLKKLHVKAGRRLAVLDAPAGFDMEASAPVAEADVVLLFAPTRAALAAGLRGLRLEDGAIVWVGYPKLTSKLAGDMHRDVIRELVPSYGFEGVAAVAIDADWSGLRLKRVVAG